MSDAKERILGKAEELFYLHGYRGTGINQIIEESGVAKATFYSHFSSKEELGVAYMQETRRKEIALLESELTKRVEAKAEKRFLTGIEILEQWLIESEFRGCGFLNVAAEFEDVENPIRQQAEGFYEEYLKRLVKLSKELIDSDKKRFGHHKAKELGQRYLTIFAGTLALCSMFKSIKPYQAGVEMVRELVK